MNDSNVFYLAEIRNVADTTNAMESLKRSLPTIIKNRAAFQCEDATDKLLY